MAKPTKWHVRPAWLRSALASAQSDQYLLCAQWLAKDSDFFSCGLRRLIRLGGFFAGRTYHFVGIVMLWFSCTIWHVRRTNIRSLCSLSTVWSGYSLIIITYTESYEPQRKNKTRSFGRALGEVLDHPARLRSLIRIFSGRIFGLNNLESFFMRISIADAQADISLRWKKRCVFSRCGSWFCRWTTEPFMHVRFEPFTHVAARVTYQIITQSL